MENRADAVLAKIERWTGSNFLPIIGPAKGKVLVEAIEEAKPRKVLEIGTLVGYSAVLIAKHLPENSKVVTLEINDEIAKVARENIAEAHLSEKVEVIVGDAKQTIKKLTGPFDLLFIDAAKEEYFNYLKAAERKLSPKAVVVADNVKVFADAMADYLDYVRSSGKYESETFDFGGDAVEVSWRV